MERMREGKDKLAIGGLRIGWMLGPSTDLGV